MAYSGERDDGVWIGQVKVINDDKWYGNNLRFDSEENAKSYIEDLRFRWTAVTKIRDITFEQGQEEKEETFHG